MLNPVLMHLSAAIELCVKIIIELCFVGFPSVSGFLLRGVTLIIFMFFPSFCRSRFLMSASCMVLAFSSSVGTACITIPYFAL